MGPTVAPVKNSFAAVALGGIIDARFGSIMMRGGECRLEVFDDG